MVEVSDLCEHPPIVIIVIPTTAIMFLTLRHPYVLQTLTPFRYGLVIPH